MYQGKSLIIIPSYNEAENIVDIINDVIVKRASFHVLVVDDNSPDKTYELVEEEIIKNPKKIFLIKRKKKSGLGTAYVEGFKWAIDNLIIEYIKINYKEIEEDMNESYNSIKKQKKNSHERKKREELSKSASRGLNCNKVKIILDFN